MKFKERVLSVKLNKKLVVVVLESKIFVYKFADISLMEEFETFPNSDGVCFLSEEILITPGSEEGFVVIKKYDTEPEVITSFKAHDSQIETLELNKDQTLLATASGKGTLIRIWDVKSGKMM